ncbi:MAG: right-handed parallel beta-helix repeat-containing protein [Phycisphaerales bacterium]|nr:right-handed parallel beta-helix repeat-containing protein [Phycisphaerales bacterium]
MCRSMMIATLTAAASLAAAGPIDPPPGPVKSTMKPLDQVEARTAINAANTPGDADSLFRITAPGSYYLIGDIQGVPGKAGIEIAADSVTIDLNGFSLLGVTGSLSGISGPSRNAIVVMNGCIRAWGGDGLYLFASADCRVHDLTLQYNAANGLHVGSHSIVDRVVACHNGAAGIDAAAYGVLNACVADDNLYGINPGAHSIVHDSQASDNASDGFACVGTEPILEGCSASSNGANGFTLSSHARIERCVASFNTGHGISFTTECDIIGNHCENNGVLGTGAGLYAAPGSGRSRIEGNTCSSNDYGIKVDGSANLVVGNRCTLNTTNFQIATGNRVATIVVLPTSGVITGNSGGDSGAADSFSNLAF